MQTFQVLCVTRRNSTSIDKTTHALWHQDIQGILALKAVLSVEMGIPVVRTIAEFTEASGQLHRGEFLYARRGLDSMATTIAFRTEDVRFPCMEVYTDMPAEGCSMPSKEIRRMAKLTINGKRADFYKSSPPE